MTVHVESIHVIFFFLNQFPKPVSMICLLIRLTQFSGSTHWLDRFTLGFELIAQLKMINKQLFFFEISVSLSHKAAV